jgi:isopenicillin-N N-acyltransferase-like protein
MFAAVARRAAKECTAFAALPQTTADEHTLVGQNWDWLPSTSDTVIVLEAEQDEGPNFVTVVEAGLLAKTGFNSAGIGLVTNALVTDQDSGQPAVPYHAVLRAILDAETMTDALDAVTRFERSSSANYLIAHRDGEAINVEAAPGDFTRTYLEFPQGGTFVHTNHYVCPTFDLRDVTLWDGPDSPFRWHRMKQFLERDWGSLTPDKVQGFLGDHFNQPTGICTHPDPRLGPADRFATIASVVMDLNSHTMWIADGNPCQTPFRAVDYSAFLGKMPAFLGSSSEG